MCVGKGGGGERSRDLEDGTRQYAHTLHDNYNLLL